MSTSIADQPRPNPANLRYKIYLSGSTIGRTLPLLKVVIGSVAAFALLFQVGHFAEHAIQFTVWVLGDLSYICGRDTPWMSPWATELVHELGLLLFPTSNASRRMMLGMETLHLIGNSIFLVGLACLYYCVRSKWARWALFVETFHLYEHILLTATAYFVGKPIGLSTLFGGSDIVGSREFAVGYRVTWHFAMNLLPMPLAMICMMETWRHTSADRPLDCASVAMCRATSG
jgi:hypothetical protein